MKIEFAIERGSGGKSGHMSFKELTQEQMTMFMYHLTSGYFKKPSLVTVDAYLGDGYYIQFDATCAAFIRSAEYQEWRKHFIEQLPDEAEYLTSVENGVIKGKSNQYKPLTGCPKSISDGFSSGGYAVTEKERRAELRNGQEGTSGEAGGVVVRDRPFTFYM